MADSAKKLKKPKKKRQEHSLDVKANSAGYLWVCSCGQIWNYCYANLGAVNRHLGITK